MGREILILRAFDFWIFWGPKSASIFFMGEKYFQESASNFFVGSKICSGICLHFLMGEKYYQEFAPIFFMGEKYFQEFAPNFFMGGPHVGPPTWAQAWAQAPPAPAPAPDEFSDPNLTPLPTHPGMKYVARTLAATLPQNLCCNRHCGKRRRRWRTAVISRLCHCIP